MSLYTFISLLYKQLLHYTLLKTFTVPSALLTKFAKKFQTKLLASAFDFTKLSTKTLLLWRCHVSLEYRGLLQNTSSSFLLFLSMVKLRCKRHYKNLATYSWCTTWREHVMKTAPARRRHSVGGGGGGSQLYPHAQAQPRVYACFYIEEWIQIIFSLPTQSTCTVYSTIVYMVAHKVNHLSIYD